MPGMQTLQVPFTGGMDQATAPEFVDPAAKLISVSNGLWHHEGGIEKRLGVKYLPNAQMPGDPTMQAPMRLLSRGLEVSRIDGDSLFVYSPTAQRWAQRALVSPCVATRAHWLSTPVPLYLSVSDGSGYTAMAYALTATVPQTIYVSLQDSATGASIISNLLLGDGAHNYTQPQCLIVAGSLYVLAIKLGNSIVGWSLNLSTMVWSAETVITAPGGGKTINCFDVTPRTGGTGMQLTWSTQLPAPSSTWLFASLSTSLVLGTNNAILAIAGTVTSVVCRWDAGTNNGAWYAAHVTATGDTLLHELQVAMYTTSNSNIFGPTSVTYSGQSGALGFGSLSLEIVSDQMALIFIGPLFNTDLRNAPAAPCAVVGVDVSGANRGSIQLPWTMPASRPFMATVNGTSRCYALALFTQFSASTQVTKTNDFNYSTSSYYLIDFGAPVDGILAVGAALPRVVASLAPRQGVITPYIESLKPAYGSGIGSPTAGTFRVPILLAGSEEFSQSEAFPLGQPMLGVDVAALDFTGATTWSSAEGNQQLAIACGVPRIYDGVSASEFGFYAWPYASAVNFGAGSLSSGTYGYALCFSQVDAEGCIHRSALYTLSVTSAASTQNVLTVTNLEWTDRYSANRPVLIEVYRTTANGSVYYYVGNAPTVSTSNTGTVVIDDGLGDASISSNTTVYTTGGVLDSVTPPSFRHVIQRNQRFWGIDDTGYVIWFSTAINGADAPYFNEGLTIQFEDGPLTALASLDAHLVVFSRSKVWIIDGDGPAITGVGSDLTNPATVMTDVGPADWRSVVATPVGIFFQAASNGGIYLLGRDLQVSYVGKTVQDTAGPYASGSPQVVQATLLPDSGQVRFLLSNHAVLAFDYVLQRWSTLSYSMTPQCALTVPATGQWYLGGGDGYAYAEQPPSAAQAWYDIAIGGAAWVTTTIFTGTIRGQGLQSWLSWGPVQCYATWLDAADINMQLRFDNSQAFGQPATFAHAQLAAANSVAAQWQMQPRAANSSGQALQIVLNDAQPADHTDVSGRGLRWLGFAADVTLIGGRNLNLPASAKA